MYVCMTKKTISSLENNGSETARFHVRYRFAFASLRPHRRCEFSGPAPFHSPFGHGSCSHTTSAH